MKEQVFGDRIKNLSMTSPSPIKSRWFSFHSFKPAFIAKNKIITKIKSETNKKLQKPKRHGDGDGGGGDGDDDQ